MESFRLHHRLSSTHPGIRHLRGLGLTLPIHVNKEYSVLRSSML